MELISVEQAQHIINEHQIEIGTKSVSIDDALGQILAENIYADRDFPPFDRVSMDGIAIAYVAFEKGQREFDIQAIHTAGDKNIDLKSTEECIEVMTGAILPLGTDTVIRYEDLQINENKAFVKINEIKALQNVHKKGIDKKANDLLIASGTKLKSAHIAVLASVGKTIVLVKNPPKIAIISSGDELVDVQESPLEYQIRKSNDRAIKSLLGVFGQNTQLFHIKDNYDECLKTINDILADYDILILSGGVSMGKKDYLPQVLTELGVKKLFHKISQKPGKPMWFGTKANKVVFALPGNPSSTVVCTMAYVIPWLKRQMKIENYEGFKVKLSENITFKPDLTYYLQAKLIYKAGQIYAEPIANNGSGDFFNLTSADGFIILPKTENAVFEKDSLVDFITF